MKIVFKIVAISAIMAGCSKLDEKLGSQLSTGGSGGGGVTASNVLAGTYDAMRTPYQDQSRVWASQEHTTDECIGPTRQVTGMITEYGGYCTHTSGMPTMASLLILTVIWEG